MNKNYSPKLSMNLTTGGFEKFLRDGGGIDFRLDEECWKALSDGDVFEFVEDPGGERKYCVEILKKYRATNFSDLIDSFPDQLFDKSSKQDYIEFFSQWWSEAEQAKEGVLGLHIKVLDSELHA